MSGVDQDTMRKRVQAFTEGVVLMVCPVLLAVALKKADLKRDGNGSFVGGGISPLAAVTLEAGLLSFLFLGISNSLPASHGLTSLLFRASKLLVHLCALLLMALAYGILLLIDMDKHMYCLAGLVLALLVPPTLFRCYRSMRNGGDDHAGGCDAALANSVDFSSAITTLLFLGLEGLALEGQSRAACHGLERLFTASLSVTYLTCALGVLVMLLGTVPQAITDDQGDRTKVCHVAELLNVALSVAIAVVVVLITAASLREQAWLVFVPLILSFVTWMYRALVGGDGCRDVLGDSRGEIKPAASLELTKVTFTGFLAVAVPTFSNAPVGISTRGFVALSAASVMSDLGWRLLMMMHHNVRRMAPSPDMVSVANFASLLSHFCVAAAVIPFATLAVNAVSSSEPGSGCH